MESDLKQTSEVKSHLVGCLGEVVQSLESFATLDVLNAWILPFWCWKMAKLKDCDNEN